MSDIFIQFARPEVLIPLILGWLTQKAKHWSWAKWITPETREIAIRRWFALVSALATVGMTASYDAGTLTIKGLTWENLLALIWVFGQSQLGQRAGYLAPKLIEMVKEYEQWKVTQPGQIQPGQTRSLPPEDLPVAKE